MSRVHIEEEFLSEGKLRVLSNNLDGVLKPTKKDAAMGLMVRLWHNSQAELAEGGTKSDIIQWAELPKKHANKVFAILLATGRIKQISNDFYEISGNKKQISGIQSFRENGRKGGLKLQQKLRILASAASSAASSPASSAAKPSTSTSTSTSIYINKGTSTPSKIKKIRVLPSSADADLAERWFLWAKERAPKTKFDQTKFAEAIAKAKKDYALTDQEMDALFEFVRADEFYGQNFLSPCTYKNKWKNGMTKMESALAAQQKKYFVEDSARPVPCKRVF